MKCWTWHPWLGKRYTRPWFSQLGFVLNRDERYNVPHFARYFGLLILLPVCCACRPAADLGQQQSQYSRATESNVDPATEFRQVAEQLESGTSVYFGRQTLQSLRSAKDQISDWPLRRCEILAKLTMEELQFGNLREAKAAIDEALEIANDYGGLDAEVAVLHRARGLVDLREAERLNCVEGHCAESCIFPVRRGGVHQQDAPARRALAEFETYLASGPADRLSAMWLLNILHMILDSFPDGVPPELRIDPAVYTSQTDIGRFVEVAKESGLNAVNLAGGVVVDDFDNDGLLDVVTSTMDIRGSLRFFHNLGNGQFEDLTERAGIAEQWGGLNCNACDYDNDGDRDVLVLRGGWLTAGAGCIRNSLLRNNGDLTFTDVTHEAGLAYPAYPSQAGVWADFDNDGDADLYVANESPSETTASTNYPSQLFINQGDGTFLKNAAAAGVTNDLFAKGAAGGDYDNDGDIDIFVTNFYLHDPLYGLNRLYRNNGDGTFTDVAASAGLADRGVRSFACVFFDFNNDGWLDIFSAAYDGDFNEGVLEEVIADTLGQGNRLQSSRLFLNDQQGRFHDVTEEVGLDRALMPMGLGVGDVDNDGWLDVYLGTGGPNYDTLVPNVMLRNANGERWDDITNSSGLGHLQKGHGIAFSDIDNDGDQDIYAQLGGAFVDDRFANALFLNPGHKAHFLCIDLEGVQSNRQGIGARVHVMIDTPQGQRSLHRVAGLHSSFGSVPARVEIGLADATRIERLTVEWPTSDTVQTFEDVPLDSFIKVVEEQPQWTPLSPVNIDLPVPAEAAPE